MQTDTIILIKAMRILAEQIESEDGVANAAIGEASYRLEELYEMNQAFSNYITETTYALQEGLSYGHISRENWISDTMTKAIVSIEEDGRVLIEKYNLNKEDKEEEQTHE